MSELWVPNENYDTHKPQSLENMPYKRLYKDLTPEELDELLRDAKRLRWEILDLRDCHLQAVPYDVAALGLPFVIDNYAKGNGVNLTGVTLDEGDLQLFAQSREVIDAYYQKQTQVRECKVIFLGDGNAGKSSLIERMVNGTFEPGSLPTDGVKMTKWQTTMECPKRSEQK